MEQLQFEPAKSTENECIHDRLKLQKEDCDKLTQKLMDLACQYLEKGEEIDEIAICAEISANTDIQQYTLALLMLPWALHRAKRKFEVEQLKKFLESEHPGTQIHIVGV